jgi:hypothetical protein
MERDAANRRREETQALLHSQRAEYVKACWGPAVGAKTPLPPPVRISVDFDATGREVARRAFLLIPAREPESAEGKLAACVASGKPPRLKTTPPGKPESMALQITF